MGYIFKTLEFESILDKVIQLKKKTEPLVWFRYFRL
ncbi:hypothetical protein M2326_001732 [Flavobacterium sp. 7A]|nr:hypothetical protein [Flavobacterium sp. 7A]